MKLHSCRRKTARQVLDAFRVCIVKMSCCPLNVKRHNIMHLDRKTTSG